MSYSTRKWEWKRVESKYKEVSEPNARKLKYLGYCSKCNKDTFQRWYAGTHITSDYRCMKCNTINTEKLFDLTDEQVNNIIT